MIDRVSIYHLEFISNESWMIQLMDHYFGLMDHIKRDMMAQLDMFTLQTLVFQYK